jgi:hypothetical protein
MAVQFDPGRLSLLNFKLAPFTIRKKKRETVILQPETHRPNFTISWATSIECASICFAILPGRVSEPKGNFPTLSAYTFTKYR